MRTFELSPPRGGARRKFEPSPLRAAPGRRAFRKVELYSALIRLVAPLKRLSSLAATAQLCVYSVLINFVWLLSLDLSDLRRAHNTKYSRGEAATYLELALIKQNL